MYALTRRPRKPGYSTPGTQSWSRITSGQSQRVKSVVLPRQDGGVRNSDRHPATSMRIRQDTLVMRYPFRAEIRRRSGPAPDSYRIYPSSARWDAGPGEERGGEDYLTLFQQLGNVSTQAEVRVPSTTSTETPVEAPEGMPLHLPDIEIPVLAELEKSDAIQGAFTYRGSIARGGAAPSGFGTTRSFSSRLTGVTITPTTGTFK